MKTYKNLYKKATTLENIKDSIINASKNGKMKKRQVQKIVVNIDKESEIVREMMIKHETSFGPYELYEIHDGIKQKRREIAKPKFKYDQIIQHVLITQIKPIVLHSLYEHAYGSLENRGPLQAAKVINKWIQKDPKGTRYCLQMDVHHCYPSVDQEILIHKWHEKVKDVDFNIENDKIIRASPLGLAPGSPVSIWHIHFLFTPFDHWVTELEGVGHYLRYADDLLIFGPNKKKLHKIEKLIISYMKKEFNMEINHSRQVFPIEWIDKKDKKHGKPLDVCGYLFYRDHMILRESHLLRSTRKASKIGKKDRTTFYDGQQMLSHLGWFKHANLYCSYEEWIKPNVKVKELKRLISKHARKEKRKHEMENGDRL